MTPHEFVAKWRTVTLTERSAAQQHFLDLCRLLGQPTPAEADPDGSWYTFEKGLSTESGGQGYADVWMRRHFAWEYKGNHKDLTRAYQQLQRYREALENPPLLVVSDFQRFEIHTNFTNTAKQVHSFRLEELPEEGNLALLRALFTAPESLRPAITPHTVSEQAAERFGRLALSLHGRGVEPHRAAHFLVQLLFCLFAEDVGLLPNRIFSRMLEFSARNPERFTHAVAELLTAMRDGGYAAYEQIERFNGGLFVEIERFNGGLFVEIGVEPLTVSELTELAEAAKLDWTSIEPAIIGTLFERSLDPARRAQLGAHYTGRADIERVVEPVVMTPLRRRWDEVRAEADAAKAAWDAAPTAVTRNNRRQEFASLLFSFQEELAGVTILDPACGSGNFLYVALAKLKDLEKELVAYGSANGLPAMFPRVAPTQLSGLEINPYARELTQAVVWIGYLQWMHANGFQVTRDPVLDPLETIRLQDALLDRSDPANPKEAEWPAADYVIGNPPFLGGNRVRQELGDEYLEDLFKIYVGRVPHFADLVCYFFEKARFQIEHRNAQRAGLLATNSIRGGANRTVLDRIKQSGDIFMAWDDEPWILDGAAVRISIVGFDDGSDTSRTLNGAPTTSINPNLTGTLDITVANRLSENTNIAFKGVDRSGPFVVSAEIAEEWMSLPQNPNGRPNSDVVRPWMNGADLNQHSRGVWIVDFGVDTTYEEAAYYEAPFEYIREHVYPVRQKSRDKRLRELWWIYQRPRPGMRNALDRLERYIATSQVAKHRIYYWLNVSILPSNLLIVFAREDDYFFGVLHSRAHERWSLRMGTWLGKGNDPRYTPTTCFETFPFPWPPGQERQDDPRVVAIAEAAKELNQLRENWLNPESATEAELKKRTLTNLYNQRPTWLANAHASLDRAVWAAYGWDDPDPTTVEEDVILARLLALNLERAQR